MDINRTTLIKHLESIYTGGLLSRVVLRPDLSVSALTPDASLFVDVPSLEEDILPEPVGIIDLNLILRALKSSDADSVGISYNERDERLVLDLPDSTGSMVTSDPSYVKTQVGDFDRQQLLAALSEHENVAVSPSVVEEILGWVKLIDPDYVTFRSQDGDAECFIGNQTGHNAKIPIPELNAGTFSVRLRANVMTAALNQIDPEAAQWVFTGSESIVGIIQNDYKWVAGPVEDE